MNINFKGFTSFLGRNGMFKCSGINIFKLADDINPTIQISPITSRGLRGRSMIEIPFDYIPDLIKSLQEMVDNQINEEHITWIAGEQDKE